MHTAPEPSPRAHPQPSVEPSSEHRHGVPGEAPLRIDCDECVLQATNACADCVITFLCGEDSASPVVVDLAEARAMRLLDDAGLAPPLRHTRRTG